MNKTTRIHPDTILDVMLSTAAHPTKRRNLSLIHEVCREREKLDSQDFSLRAVGESAEARGGPKVKALWNPQSADYRKLIETWQAYAGAPVLREVAKSSTVDVITQNIPDPATRIVVEKLMKERNTLRSEVNILKAQTKFVIDKRPQIATPTASTANGEMTLEIASGPKLNTLEREAIEHAVSPEFWRIEGWVSEKNGRVVKDLGEGRTRTVFKPGFVNALRKILDTK
jgi:hypothetical protein